MSPESLIDIIIKFREARDWEQFHTPKNLAVSLLLEASEVLELFQWSPDNQLPKQKKKELEEELADVYYYILLMAHDTGVDLDKALRQKMRKNEKKYPVKKCKGISKKYTEFK